MDETAEVLAAARKIKDYCAKHPDCYDGRCYFWKIDYCCLKTTPEGWSIPEIDAEEGGKH